MTNSWVDNEYHRYRVIPTYDGYLRVIGWSVWDSERGVNVVATETVECRGAVQIVSDYLNSGALIHYVEG